MIDLVLHPLSFKKSSGSSNLWLQHAQPTIPHQLRQQHSVAATCSANYTTPTQAATLCGCNMLSQLYHTNSGSNTLWLQHAQPTIPHQLRQQHSVATTCSANQFRQQHSVAATCSANYTAPTQAATLCGCNMLINSGSKLQHAQPTIPHKHIYQHISVQILQAV